MNWHAVRLFFIEVLAVITLTMYLGLLLTESCERRPAPAVLGRWVQK